MKLVVNVGIRLYDDDRYVLVMTYGEDKKSLKHVEELFNEEASNACYYLRKSYVHGEGEKYQFFDWKTRRFSNSASHLENNKMLSEIRGTGKEECIRDLIGIAIGIENEDFRLSHSQVDLYVSGPLPWIAAWEEAKSRITIK